MMPLSLRDVDMVAADGGDTAAYLRATSQGAAPIAIPVIEDMVVADGGATDAYL